MHSRVLEADQLGVEKDFRRTVTFLTNLQERRGWYVSKE